MSDFNINGSCNNYCAWRLKHQYSLDMQSLPFYSIAQQACYQLLPIDCPCCKASRRVTPDTHFFSYLLPWVIQGNTMGRVQLKCDGTRWRRGGEGKGKLTNGVGSQYTSHYLGTWCIQHYCLWCVHPRIKFLY